MHTVRAGDIMIFIGYSGTYRFPAVGCSLVILVADECGRVECAWVGLGWVGLGCFCRSSAHPEVTGLLYSGLTNYSRTVIFKRERRTSDPAVHVAEC